MKSFKLTISAAMMCGLALASGCTKTKKTPLPSDSAISSSPANPASPTSKDQPAPSVPPKAPGGGSPPRGDESGLISPFPSTVEGLSIANAHLVGRREGEVLRGMSPVGKTSEMVKHGVTDIVIFKDEYKGDIQKELAELHKNGFTPDRIHLIPFRWRDIVSFKDACEQMIDALQILETAYRTPERSVYFHCTVGEDRTGMLAGIFKMIELSNEGWNARKAFEEEMCMNGYEAGNPSKPDFVVEIIRKEMTPIFAKLATLVESGAISTGHLDRAVCATDLQPHYDARDFVCKASPLSTASGPAQ